MMERVNAILQHTRFVEELERIKEYEKNRSYCRHGLDHLLDVARIAYILNSEINGERVAAPNVTKELIYAAALLHDIGRAKQYEDGTPHEKESAGIAEKLLPGCGFTKPETMVIIYAILSHRTNSSAGKPGLSGLLYRADKLSRRCFDCSMINDCDRDRKNTGLEY